MVMDLGLADSESGIFLGSWHMSAWNSCNPPSPRIASITLKCYQTSSGPASRPFDTDKRMSYVVTAGKTVSTAMTRHLIGRILGHGHWTLDGHFNPHKNA